MFSVLGNEEALVTLGERIRATRLRANLKQDYVAGVARVSLPTYRRVESGDGRVAMGVVARVMGVLGCVDALAGCLPEHPPLSIREMMKKERRRASGGKR